MTPTPEQVQAAREVHLKHRSTHDALVFLLDSTVDLPPPWSEAKGRIGYDRDTLLMRLEAYVLTREAAVVERCAMECEAFYSCEGIAEKCADAIRALGRET